jgi:hypothetical protein
MTKREKAKLERKLGLVYIEIFKHKLVINLWRRDCDVKIKLAQELATKIIQAEKLAEKVL